MSGQVVRIETQSRKSGGPRYVRIYSCSDCGSAEVRVRGKEPKPAEGRPRCQSCSHRKRPFESIYRGLFNDHRGTAVSLTYAEYVEFTRQTNCHYCGDSIPWQAYSMVRGEYTSRAYFLDRKDHTQGYSRENCVVCCTECNRMRSDKYTFAEFCELAPLLQRIRSRRKEGNGQDQAAGSAEGAADSFESSSADCSQTGAAGTAYQQTG